MVHSVSNCFKRSFLLIFYCSPGIVALALILPGYYQRVESVSAKITERAVAVNTGQIDAAYLETSYVPEKEKRLIQYFLRSRTDGDLAAVIQQVEGKTRKIFIEFSLIVTVMTLLPFFFLGMKVAFRFNRKDIQFIDRIYSVTGDWWIKLLFACTIATGWLYAINSEGRGGTTLSEYINTQDIFTDTTLPGFIQTGNIPFVIAGFLGWYLNLVSYFISKLYYDDVYGTRVYRFLMGKLLFVYGIALVLSSLGLEQGKVAIFLIGYFPLSALTILKEFGIKAMQGGDQDKGALIDLPSISRNQILRLHEEGIDNINALASYPRIAELKKYQYAIAPMVDYWVDVARLYSIVGPERASKLKEYCSTASEFLRIYKTPQFRKTLDGCGVKNPDETARLLLETYSNDEKLLEIKPETGKK